jgi:hypothetical protein
MEGEVVEANTHPMHAHTASTKQASKQCDRATGVPSLEGSRPCRGGMPQHKCQSRSRVLRDHARAAALPRVSTSSLRLHAQPAWRKSCCACER